MPGSPNIKRIPARAAAVVFVVFCLLSSETVTTPATVDSTSVSSAPLVISGTIDGAIGPATRDFLRRVIETANEKDASCVVIQMDTPGGLSVSMRDIIQDILASGVPVVVYVAPGGARAASAGALISLAAHVAAMAPGTNIGAAEKKTKRWTPR
jgi:membrane-bound serine protease (ClpP class)